MTFPASQYLITAPLKLPVTKTFVTTLYCSSTANVNRLTNQHMGLHYTTTSPNKKSEIYDGSLHAMMLASHRN